VPVFWQQLPNVLAIAWIHTFSRISFEGYPGRVHRISRDSPLVVAELIVQQHSTEMIQNGSTCLSPGH
jgi:hypothetical protein